MRIYFNRKSNFEAEKKAPQEMINPDSILLQKNLDSAQRDIERGEGVIEVSPSGVAGGGKVGFSILGDLD